MAIINRTLDASEQKELVQAVYANTVTGATMMMYKAPRAQVISDAKCSTVGMSGAPTATLVLQRFVVGAGLTTITISGALTQAGLGTSGSQTFSLPASGSSLLQLASGDLLTVVTGGANSATIATLVDVVVSNISDVKAWY